MVYSINRSLLVAGILLLTGVSMAVAQSSEPVRSLNVSGEGTVRVEPDMVIVRFGIYTQSEDPEEAREKNATASRNALNVVRELNVPERKIKLEQLRLQPAREYNPNTRRYEETGFEVMRSLVVELEDLEQLPTLIARVVQEGANRLDGVTYDLKDREAAKNEALREAVMNAKAKAELMVVALEATLGEIMHINEQGVVMPQPYRMQMAMDAEMMKAQAAPEPEAYAAGELEVTANVNLTFALK